MVFGTIIYQPSAYWHLFSWRIDEMHPLEWRCLLLDSRLNLLGGSRRMFECHGDISCWVENWRNRIDLNLVLWYFVRNYQVVSQFANSNLRFSSLLALKILKVRFDERLCKRQKQRTFGRRTPSHSTRLFEAINPFSCVCWLSHKNSTSTGVLFIFNCYLVAISLNGPGS